MQALRRVWLKCHRWIALTLGWVLILSGITGSLLVVARPVDRWLHPDYFVAATREPYMPVSLESLRRRLTAEFGPHASFTFSPPRQQGDTMQVLVRGGWRGTLYLDPSSGAEQGRRGDTEGVVAMLYGLHSALWMQQTGKAVLAGAALSYLVLFVTGLVLWWPRVGPSALRVEFGKGGLRALLDLHRTAGVVLGCALAICITTGAYLAWRPIGGWITWLSGTPRTLAPTLPPWPPAPALLPPSLPAIAGPSAPPGDRAADTPMTGNLDVLAARAQAAFPQGTIGYFLYTPRTDRPLAVRMRLPDDPHPNGRSTVWLDPRSGMVLAAQRWNELDPGTRVNSYIYPLHTGELGGPPWQAGVAILGLILGALGTSGIWLWWRRRAARQRVRRYPGPAA